MSPCKFLPPQPSVSLVTQCNMDTISETLDRKRRSPNSDVQMYYLKRLA